MALMAMGDEPLIKWLSTLLWFATVTIIAFLLAFGMVQFFPGDRTHKQITCTVTYHPYASTYFIKLNWPLGRTCHG